MGEKLAIGTVALLALAGMARRRGSHNTVTAYHGGPVRIRRFDRNKTMMGVFWFSEDKGAVVRGQKANQTDWLMTVHLDVGDRIAGWDEYDRLGWQRLEENYDSVHLDETWVIFDPDRITIVKAQQIPKGSRGELVDLGAQRSRREAEEEAKREAQAAQLVQRFTARQQAINRFLAGAKTQGLLQPVHVMVGWDPTAAYFILDTQDNTIASPAGRTGLEVVEGLMFKGVDPARDLWENVRRMNEVEGHDRFLVLQVPKRPSERGSRALQTFFHGTSDEAADEIMENGFTHEIVRRRDPGDFGWGVYVTQDREWAESLSGGGTVIELEVDTQDFAHLPNPYFTRRSTAPALEPITPQEKLFFQIVMEPGVFTRMRTIHGMPKDRTGRARAASRQRVAKQVRDRFLKRGLAGITTDLDPSEAVIFDLGSIKAMRRELR